MAEKKGLPIARSTFGQIKNSWSKSGLRPPGLVVNGTLRLTRTSGDLQRQGIQQENTLLVELNNIWLKEKETEDE